MTVIESDKAVELADFLRGRGWKHAADPDFARHWEAVQRKIGWTRDLEPPPPPDSDLWLNTRGFDHVEERTPEPYLYADRPRDEEMPPIRQLTRVPPGVCRPLAEAVALERRRPA